MRFLFFTILIFISSIVLAQAPQGFTYQGVATNNEGIEISNQDISIRVSILAETASGNSVYLETHLTTTDAFGLFNVVIGSGQTESDFSTIDWGSSAHFLKIELDINGGSEYIHIGTQQMMSVPYALYAENTSLDSTSLANILNSDYNLSPNTDDELTQSAMDNNDLDYDIENSDFVTNVVSEIPQSLDNKEIVLFSTKKSIFLTDTVGSFLSKIYSVTEDLIFCLTSNNAGDTLYFLQSPYQNNPSSIMMLTINNLNTTVIGTIPYSYNDIKAFKFKDGAFFINSNTDIYKLQNNSLELLGNVENYAIAAYSNLSFTNAWWNSGLFNITDYEYSENYYVYDLEFDDSLNLWIYADDDGARIEKHNGISKSLVYHSGNLFERSQNSGGSGYAKMFNLKYNNGKIYFNMDKTLFSINEDGSNIKIINSSDDENAINGIVILTFNYENNNNVIIENQFDISQFINSTSKKVFFSTFKSIYLTDSAGTSINKIYSVDNDFIYCLTSNDLGDTLYFLQSPSNFSACAIMMLTCDNLNISKIGTIPTEGNYLKTFKYKNGAFYYVHYDKNLIKLQNSTVELLSVSPEDINAVAINSSFIHSYKMSGEDYITGYNYQTDATIIDLDFDDSSNLFIYEYYDGPIIKKHDGTNVSVVYDSDVNLGNGANVLSSLKHHNGKIYFNWGKTLFSLDENGSDFRIINSSKDEFYINGIVITE